MKNKSKNGFIIAGSTLFLFVLWTVLLRLVDVEAIGPQGSEVGFATLNRWVHGVTGVHMTLYTVTDWLGLVSIGVALGFAVLGLFQWIKRKRFWNVDYSVLILGCFYMAVMAVYLFFEMVVVNYRPILIGGSLEVSYPSSTTLLVMCVMPTAMMQWKKRIRHTLFRRCVLLGAFGFTAFMVIGRLISGVHWFSDIVGGTILSMGLVVLYASVVREKR